MSGLLSRIGDALAKREGSPLPEVSSSRYQFFRRVGTYTNETSRFIVILGFPATVTTATVTLGGVIHDSTSQTTANLSNQTLTGTAPAAATWGGLDPSGNTTTIDLNNATWTLVGQQTRAYTFSKKMLLPPGFVFNISTLAWFGVVCQTLEDALAIL